MFMTLIISAALTLTLSILALFVDRMILDASLPLLAALLLALSLVSRKKALPGDRPGASSPEDDSVERKRLTARLKEMEDSYRTLLAENRERRDKGQSLVEEASYLNTALPMMKDLATLIIDKTEESAMNLTKNIFEISNRSSLVGSHISTFLGDLFSGDRSLKHSIDVLGNEMKRINRLIGDFTAISKRYTQDMKQIDENVKTIKGYLNGIRDVSDRTGLLAINSSIEAARVGSAGRGFSVLAGEIQGLASSSRELSIQIEDVVAGISERVDESFQALESKISLSLNELNQTRGDLEVIASNLNDKIADVEHHVKDSDSLSRTVTEQLGNVTVNLQYQDITRQILEHIISTLHFFRTRMEEKEPLLVAASESKAKREEVLAKMSSFFTIEDEWKLFGLDVLAGQAADGDQEEVFKGNVEMF